MAFNRRPVGRKGEFDRETDIAWDSKGNMFIPDGYEQFAGGEDFARTAIG